MSQPILNPSQLAALRDLDDLTLGVTYVQTAWEKAKPAIPDDLERAAEIRRIMAAPVDLSIPVNVIDLGYGLESDMTGACHDVKGALRYYSAEELAALGRRIRCCLPTPEVDKLKAQVAGLLADIEARKAHEAELWGHLHAAQNETSTARSWAGRLQRQLDECDCEE